MKKILILFLFITSLASGQDVIDFKLLYEKKIKNTANYNVSDNTIDFKNIDHQGSYYVRFIGQYPKLLLLKNLVGGTFIFEGGVTAATNNKTVRIAACKRITIDLTQGTITGNGASSGECGQLLYIYDKWQDITIKGGRLHQNGSYGGAAFQTESYSDPNFSHGTLILDGLIVTKAMGEGVYVGYNQPTKAYIDTLIIRNTNISNTRRDFWQQANVRYTIIENNIGDNGGLEMNSDHVSGLSLNGKNNLVIIRNNSVSKVAQFIYSSTQSKIQLENNTYTQGEHAGPRMNQAIYTKSSMTLRNNVISTPAAKEAAITADGCAVELISPNKITAPKLSRTFNGGSVIVTNPPPVTVLTHGVMEIHTTTTWDNVVTIRYFSIVDGVKTEFVKL